MGDEIVERAVGLSRWPQPVAEDVLFADDGDMVGLETGFHADDRQHGLVARRGLHGAPAVDAGEVVELVIPEHAAHAIARALAPQRDHHFLAPSMYVPDMRDHGLEP